MTVTEAQCGKAYEVIKVNGDRETRRRLLEMGFTPETKITLTKASPFGGGVAVRVRGSEIALRSDVAALIEVQG